MPEDERRRWARGWWPCSSPTPTPADYARAKEASDAVVAQLRQLVEDQARHTRRRPRAQPHRRPGTETSDWTTRSCSRPSSSSSWPVTTRPRPSLAMLSSRCSVNGAARVVAPRSGSHPGRRRGTTSLRRTRAPFDLPLRSRAVEIGGRSFRPAPRSSLASPPPTVTPALHRAPTARLGAGARTSPGVRARHPPLPGCAARPHRRQTGAGIAHPPFPPAHAASERADLHWGHGDGLVLRGLSELPVIPGPARLKRRPALSSSTGPAAR